MSREEDLKEEISKWRNHYISVLDNNFRIDLRDVEVIAKHFAEWQKEKMNDALQTEYEKGRFDMREEMMKNTVTEIKEWQETGELKKFKPYLRPMSSMTQEEAVVISAQQGYMASAVLQNDNDSFYDCLTKHLNYLNAHRFDYRGLINKGLAIEAPEGMYKE